MRALMKSGVVGLCLAVIVLVAFGLRVSGTKFGLPETMHPDEARIILDSMSMGQRMSLISEDINYPLFHKYILLLFFGLYYVLGVILGYFADRVDFAVSFFVDPSKIVLLSRLVTTALGTLCVVAGYFWGRLVSKSKITGLAAAMFVALEWQLVFESQYAVHQTLSTLTSLLAFLGLSLICMQAKKQSYIVGGVLMGLAVASHQTTILLLPSVVFLFVSDMIQNKSEKILRLKRWLLFSAITIAIGILGNLNWIFKFQQSLNFFLQGSGAGKVAFSSTPYFLYNVPSIMYWYFFEMIRRNYFIGAMVLFSWLAAIIRRSKLDILYIIISLTYFVFFYSWTYRWMHLFVGLIPISLMFAAQEAKNLTAKLKLGKYTLPIIALLITPNILNIARADVAKNGLETRQQAANWVLENIPENAKIAIDYPAYAVSLPSSYPVMLRNRVARKYYDENVPQEIKLGVETSWNGKKNYQIVEMIDSKDSPVWPAEMSEDEIKAASASTTMRDVYAYFNYKPIDSLIAEGVEYFVINSYTYGMPLVNNDPRKILMNYYLIDDVVPFAYQDGEKSTNKQHELMYYVVKRSRNYFLNLLDDENKKVQLIKEFLPMSNLGPVVKIYKVI